MGHKENEDTLYELKSESILEMGARSGVVG
jgi:hypothetical protein